MGKYIFIIFALSLTPSAFSQSAGMISTQGALPSASAAPRQPAPATVPIAPVAPASVESGGLERSMDKIFDVNSDSFDTDNGAVNWKGKTFTVGDSRIIRARFERYLARPVDPKGFGTYQGILSEITSRLAPNNDSVGEEPIRTAWDRLFDAAEYDYDGDASVMIANVVYQSWRMRDEYKTKRSEENEKERAERESKSQLVEQAEFMEYAADKLKKEGSTKKIKQLGGRTLGTAELAARNVEYEKKLAELAASKTSREATALKAILQFQSQVVSFLMGRQFQQAQIASMFYRHIYHGGAQDLQVGREQLGDMFQVSQFTPSIDTLEMVAMQARKDASDGMQAVNSLYDSGERYGALQRLMETFLLGEYDPVVIAFDFEKKRVLHKLYRDTSAIKTLADARDWGGIETILKDIEKVASDFPSREILSKIKTAERASNMHLMSAKQAAALGNVEDVKKSLTSAMELWPLNPAIESFNEELIGVTSGVSKYVGKFDELYARGNFRDIAAEAPEYGLAFRNDTARAAKLRDVVIRISQIDSMIAQASEFEKQKNPYFAWDILENARAVDSNDPELARAFARLAPEVSDYVKILNRAKTAEADGNYAEALNLYLAAQDIFPASQACRLGIERVAPRYAD